MVLIMPYPRAFAFKHPDECKLAVRQPFTPSEVRMQRTRW